MADYAHLHCSFCGKTAAEVRKLIAGPDIYICNECVDKCHGILNDGTTTKASKTAVTASKSTPTPREIKSFLDNYVIGQDATKETLAVAVYNHYKRLENPIIEDVEIEKSNILMFGPTGSGKTLLAQSIARMLDVPFTIADATSLTQAGYVGDDVESIIARLLTAADNDVKKCERGIIFLDEIDKKAARGSSSGTSLDVGGEGVQHALLKLLEGSEVMIAPPGAKKALTTDLLKINTKNILFIVGGAFIGLEKVVEKALSKDNSGIGFGSKTIRNAKKTGELLQQVEAEHLISFGLIPELVGRLPVVAGLQELSEEQLVRVMTEPKNALVKQFKAMFKLDGIELEFEPEALHAIAKIAVKRKTGGRALRSVIEGKLTRIQYNLPDLRIQGAQKIVVHAAMITDNEPPFVVFEAEATA